MIKTLIKIAAVAVLALPLFAQSATAVTVGNINTGEASYTISGPSIAGTVPVLDISKHNAWATPLGASSWVSITPSNVTDPQGVYTFTTTFDLTGFTASTAAITGQVAADNSAVFILNGVDMGITVGGFSSLINFSLLSGFMDGLNTLQILVTNYSGNGGNPMGLLISGSTIEASISAVPLPAALPLYGAGLAVMGLVGWRRKAKAAA